MENPPVSFSSFILVNTNRFGLDLLCERASFPQRLEHLSSKVRARERAIDRECVFFLRDALNVLEPKLSLQRVLALQIVRQRNDFCDRQTDSYRKACGQNGDQEVIMSWKSVLRMSGEHSRAAADVNISRASRLRAPVPINDHNCIRYLIEGHQKFHVVF